MHFSDLTKHTILSYARSPRSWTLPSDHCQDAWMMHDGLRAFPFPCTQNLHRVLFAHDEIGKLAVQGPQKGIERG